MHRATVVFVLICALGACVPSLQPLFTPDDLVTDDHLPGRYADGDDTWEFAATDSGHYALGITHSEGVERYRAHLLELDGQRYLDLLPETGPEDGTDFRRLHLLPVHSFLRVDAIGETLVLAVMNPEWLEDLLEREPAAIEHQWVSERLVLTAPTATLQAFVSRYHDVAFADPAGLERIEESAPANAPSDPAPAR